MAYFAGEGYCYSNYVNTLFNLLILADTGKDILLWRYLIECHYNKFYLFKFGFNKLLHSDFAVLRR